MCYVSETPDSEKFELIQISSKVIGPTQQQTAQDFLLAFHS